MTNTSEREQLRYEGRGFAPHKGFTRRYIETDRESPASGYLAAPALVDAVNAALILGQPLLLTGEPGTGKTRLAASLAWELDLPLLAFQTKMNSGGNDLFYHYDALLEFRDANRQRFVDGADTPPDPTPRKLGLKGSVGKLQLEISSGAERGGDDFDPRRYIRYAALGKAILYSHAPDVVARYMRQEQRPDAQDEARAQEYEHNEPTSAVVLIDEIDKAPRDFPNDILYETERLTFTVKETDWTLSANRRFWPIVICTSNMERTLPDAFLRRCVFHHIEFPSEQELLTIVNRRMGEGSSAASEGTARPVPAPLQQAGVRSFLRVRSDDQLVKKPSTAEMLQWFRLLQHFQVSERDLDSGSSAVARTLPALVKNAEDLARIGAMFSGGARSPAAE